MDIVGFYGDGKCKACHREDQRKYDRAHRAENRRRWNRWYARRKRARAVGSA